MRVCGATVSGVSGALAVGMSINGCVFFICTLDLAGGSGGTVVRAVSFFGLLVSAGGAMGKGIATAAVDPIVAAGGRAAGGSGLGTIGVGFVEGETGGRVGRLMRIVSCFAGGTSAGVAIDCGGRVMRTISFLGSAESVVRHFEH